MCCATKRRVEIPCPNDCRFLENAQIHPAAVVRRQIDHDIGILMATLGRVNEQQLQVFFLLQSQILAHKPDGIVQLVDNDVALATGALAKTLETATKGVIFDESTANVVAETLRRELKPIVDEITKDGGSRAERDVAEVLRGIERGAHHDGDASARSYLELAGRILRHQSPAGGEPPKSLIVAP